MSRRVNTALRWIAACCWIAAVIAYWWMRIPPSPRHVIPLEGRSTRWSPGMGTRIVLCGRKAGTLRPSGSRGESKQATVGPLQFYDPATGELIQSSLKADDEILTLTLKPREIAVVLRQDQVLAIAIDGEKTLCELTGMEPDSHFEFAEGGRIVVGQKGGLTAAFDLERGQQLWSRNGIGQLNGGRDGGCEIINVRRWDTNAFQNLNARSGTPDPRFANSSGPISISDDGNRFTVFENASCRVFDSLLQKDLCRVPTMRQGVLSNGVLLDQQGQRLFLWRRGRGVNEFDLWDCATGRELDVPPGLSSDLSALSSDMRVVMRSETISSFAEQSVRALPASWGSRLQKSKLFWDLMVRANRSSSHWAYLNDVATNLPLGRYEVPNFAEWLMVIDGERRVAAFGGRDAIECYSLPAGRNWIWLVKWGAVPIAVALALRRFWSLWKKRRTRTAGSKPAA